MSDCSSVFEQWLCQKKLSKKNAGFFQPTFFRWPFTESISPSQILPVRPLTPVSRRGIPQLHSWTTNWFLPGVPCASKYWSHPWFCVLGELFLFWFSFNKATKFRHFLRRLSTRRRLHYSLLAPPFFVHQPSTNGHSNADRVSKLVIRYLRECPIFKNSTLLVARSVKRS